MKEIYTEKEVEYMNNSNSYDFSVDNEHCGIHTQWNTI